MSVKEEKDESLKEEKEAKLTDLPGIGPGILSGTL